MPAQLRLIKPDEPREFFAGVATAPLWAGEACTLGAIEVIALGYRGTVAPLLAGPAAATLLFLAAWFWSTWAERRCITYVLEAMRLSICRGIFRRRFESIELSRIREARLQQTALQRWWLTGRITLVLDDSSRSVIVLGPLREAAELHRKLRARIGRELTPSAEPVRDRR